MSYLKDILYHRYNNPNYLLFTISLFLLILLPAMSSIILPGHLLLNITFALVIAMGVIFISSSRKDVYLLFIIGTLLYCTFLFRNGQVHLEIVNVLLIFLFFSLLLYKLLKYILRSDHIDFNAVLASISGYLMLGIIASSVFSFVATFSPDSFHSTEPLTYHDYLYFSFTTLTTVGYGDIVPIHSIAKSLSVITGISGQIYLTFIVAIIIGKFLQSNSSNKSDQ